MSRRTQPYRKGPRPPGQALNAMLKGRTASGFNPKDSQRNAQKLVRAGKQQMRPPRPDRVGRPDRPPRLASTASTDAQSGGGYRGIGKGTYRARAKSPSVVDGGPDWKAPSGSKRYIPRRQMRPIPTHTGSRGLRHDGPPEQQNMIYKNKRRRRLI